MTTKLCKQIQFTANMPDILNQSFLSIVLRPNYYECVCRADHLNNYRDIIKSDCRLFVHLFSLVSSGKNLIKFQMPNGNISSETCIPENTCYMYPDSVYRTSLGPLQGQFLIKHKKLYWGLDREGVKSMKLEQWKRLYLDKIGKVSRKTLIQNIKCSIIYNKLTHKQIIFKVKRWNTSKFYPRNYKQIYHNRKKKPRIKHHNNNEQRRRRW